MMKGYVSIPPTIHCKPCKQCGERPIIALVGQDGYVVKCPANNSHYQTQPGLIDIEDWNIHNTVLYDSE
jgi:hypothetical protein